MVSVLLSNVVMIINKVFEGIGDDDFWILIVLKGYMVRVIWFVVFIFYKLGFYFI